MKPILGGVEGDLSTPLLGSKSVQDHMPSHSQGMPSDICTHNRKSCRIRALCCNEEFGCKTCHDESKNNLDKDGHKMPRKAVQRESVICSLCNTEQQLQQICINCGVCTARYICEICKVLTDDPSKKIVHCFSCGVCRQGRLEDQMIHCNKCQCCIENPHTCVEGLLHRCCPICFEVCTLYATGAMTAMPFGHIIHHPCLPELMKTPNTCPVCSKAFSDISGRYPTWRLKLNQLLRHQQNFVIQKDPNLNHYYLLHHPHHL
ncbi:hypothetical protein DCAR_0934202 [Daucus carota subsp. sativus]|uniref:CHY-type domain-containing protein n=1 Tax=Daucus carota subsp. sativus TaxID=79200 RepID=A0AAF0XWK8_DAUCS|nr:hypothetical protein DCAR_0934202 [Daucus carota subsp. sativus]